MAILKRVIDNLGATRNRDWGGSPYAVRCPNFPIRRSMLVLALCLGVIFSVLPKRAGGQAANEYQVKAAFLFNFAKFVEWPEASFTGDSAPFVVGLIGDDPFGGTIDQTLSGKTINGRQLVLRRLKWGQNLRECHILFISSSERKRIAQIFDTLRGASTLTVGEYDAFSQQGGMINFVMEENRVRFEINTGNAEQARLKISSKLLSLAKNIRNGQQAGRL